MIAVQQEQIKQVKRHQSLIRFIDFCIEDMKKAPEESSSLFTYLLNLKNNALDIAEAENELRKLGVEFSIRAQQKLNTAYHFGYQASTILSRKYIQKGQIDLAEKSNLEANLLLQVLHTFDDSKKQNPFLY